jgi:hypothetical protein
MGTRGPNRTEDILLLYISWGPADQMRVTGYFALVYFMETQRSNESDRIFCSYIFHGDQRTN